VTEYEKYKYMGKTDGENFPDEAEVEKWINDYLEGNLEEYMISAKVPESPEEDGVKILIGSEFKNYFANALKIVVMHIWTIHT
jgi:hypothetical protein